MRRCVDTRVRRANVQRRPLSSRIIDNGYGLANAVTDQGLSLKEYDSILEVAQNDPEVREKISQRIRRLAK